MVENGTLGMMRPRIFVAGFSKYLKVEEGKALEIINGAVASQCRSLLLEVTTVLTQLNWSMYVLDIFYLVFQTLIDYLQAKILSFNMFLLDGCRCSI